MVWTEEKLNKLSVNGGFRLRGLDATRLETFIDAAYATKNCCLCRLCVFQPAIYNELRSL